LIYILFEFENAYNIVYNKLNKDLESFTILIVYFYWFLKVKFKNAVLRERMK